MKYSRMSDEISYVLVKNAKNLLFTKRKFMHATKWVKRNWFSALWYSQNMNISF